jgi:hypothetical protein
MAHIRGFLVLVVFVAALLPASSVWADLEDQLSAYTEENAEGYLAPLADAFGSDLNSGLFYSAFIPKTGTYIRFEIRAMSVLFADDERTFSGTTEPGFLPESTVDAPTVVGPGEGVTVEGTGGAEFTFPGGFDLNSFALAVPQLRIGSFGGTEALFRYFAFDQGDVELGNVSLFGFGLRHSISQYLGPDFPVHLAGGFFWQRLDVGENDAGDDLISSRALSIGVQGSKRYGRGALMLEPYAGLSLDRFSMDLSYQSDSGGESESLDVDFGTDTAVRLTLGIGVGLPFTKFHAEYNISGQNSLSAGLAFGN